MFFMFNVGGSVMMQNMMQGIQQRIDHRAAGHLGARVAGCADETGSPSDLDNVRKEQWS
jgi:hypothetical protein